MSNTITYLDIPFNRSTESLLGTRCAFVTAGGIFTGRWVFLFII